MFFKRLLEAFPSLFFPLFEGQIMHVFGVVNGIEVHIVLVVRGILFFCMKSSTKCILVARDKKKC